MGDVSIDSTGAQADLANQDGAERSERTISPVPCLIGTSCPATVRDFAAHRAVLTLAARVATIVVATIDRHSLGPLAHVLQKRLEALAPALANTNAATAPFRVRRERWVRTPGLHRRPGDIRSTSGQVMGAARSQHLKQQAAATLSRAGAKRFADHDGFLAAFASAFPEIGIATLGVKRLHDKSAKATTRHRSLAVSTPATSRLSSANMADEHSPLLTAVTGAYHATEPGLFGRIGNYRPVPESLTDQVERHSTTVAINPDNKREQS